ncbi:MAG: isopeptide-forming domain-containing fimbrial protein, partial [Planctomycetota bacterium]
MGTEQLERRFALAAIPTATVTGGSGTLIGQEIPLTVTFDNTSTNPSDFGYGPFVDIVMPATGDAPPTPNNGISFKPSSASYNNLSLVTTVLTFDAAGKATHPFAKNPDGTALVVIGKPGDQLVVVQLPFGSYGPDQPAAAINFTGIVSPLAQPNHIYNVKATGGFQYRTDGSGNPTINEATIGIPSTDPVAPQLFRLTKTSSAPEGETATGPNFTHSYTVSMAVAPGQTVTDLLLKDLLPDNVQFVSVTNVSGNQTTTIDLGDTPSTTTPGGQLSRRLDKVVGTGAVTDAVMTFRYYVPEKDASGDDVIPLTTGGTATAVNTATADGSWTSANPNYPNPQTVSGGPATHTLTAKTTALQKSVADLTHPGSPRAGDTLEYTLNFQVSDYFALSDFDLADVLTDGQAFDTTFTPTITYTQKSQTLTGTFAPANFTYAVQANGTTKVDFDVSAQVDSLGLVTDGKLVGAGIPNTGTGSPTTLPNPTPGGPGTTGTIKFRTKILDQYVKTGAAVVQGDVISDTATTAATVLNYATLATTVNTVGDTSSASVTLVSGNATKSVYAVNGKTVSGTPSVTAGDTVTFRVTYNLPFSSIKDYKITDYLPLPIFQAQGLTFTSSGPATTAPASGQWKFGPLDNYSKISRIIPTVSFNAAANSETWDFGTFQDNLDQSSTTDILFTVTATNRPFADGLLLTNQAEQQEKNETGDVLTSNTALAQVKMSEPLLNVTKGVVSTNDLSAVFLLEEAELDPPQIAPPGVTFSKPGVPGASFTGTITSTGLAEQPITAAVANVIGNDLVKFCIIVQNTGSGPHGAFDVKFKDTFNAAKMKIPANATGLNLKITDGTGTALRYTGDLFGSGITLVDPSTTTGSLSSGKTTAGTVIDTGRNIAVITYDLQLRPDVAPADVIPNTATVTNYASTEGGPNFTPPDGISDSTTVTVVSPSAGKTLVDTSIIDTNNSRTQAVIGEKATFELTIKVPEGTTPGAVVVDTLPAGLAFVQMVGTPVVESGVTVSGSFTPVVTNNGQTLTFNIGNIGNTNTDRKLFGFTLRYETVVLNVSSNIINKTLTNSAKLNWTGHTELPAATSATPVTVIEPKLKIDKTVDKATAQASDTVTFTIVLSHTAQSQTDAHNVDLSDVIPAGLTYVAGSLRNTAGVAPNTLTQPSGGSTFTATYNKLAKGATSTLTFQAKLDPNVIAGAAIVNTATETWTSLPGSPSQISSYNTNSFERTGVPTDPGQLNNYQASDPATVTVAQPSVTKALVTTSIVNASNSATQAVIGEKATYTVTMKIPQGRTPAAKLLDTLPGGMAYVQTISAVNNAPSFLTVPGLSNAPTLGTGAQTVTYDLGDIVNTDTNSATDETITFTIEVVVLNVTGNVSGTSLVNKAKATWNSGKNFTADVSSGAVTVIEPKLLVQKAKSVGGLGGNVGDPVTYTITITNYGSPATDAYNATLSDVIPAEISGVSIYSVTDPSGNATLANFGLAGNTISTTTPFKVPTSTTVTIVVKGTLAGPVFAGQQIVNTAFSEWTSLPGDPGQITTNNLNAYERTGSGSTTLGQLNNYHASGVATIIPNSADLAVVKTVSNASPNVGDTITFTITVTNNGPSIAHNVEIKDTFPSSSELTFISASPSAAYDAITGFWTVGTVNVGAANKQTLTLTARVNAPSTPGAVPATLTNSASVTKADEPDPNPGNNTGTVSETPKYADLGVKKTTSNVSPNVGDTITYTVSLFNLGTSTATNVEVTDTLPGNVAFVSASAAAGTTFTPGGVGGIWTVPSIAPGQTKLLTIIVRATASGTSFNTVTITDSDVYDPNSKNNTAKTPTSPLEADLVVTKTVDNDRPQVGSNVTFTVTLENLGPSAAANVVVADPLPAGLELVSATASAGSYNSVNGNWTLGTVTANTTSTLTIVAKVLTALPKTNTATATSTTPDPNPDNTTDSSTATPLQADLAVFKTVSNSTPNVGDTITFAIGVANYGPDTATNVKVLDTIPAGVTYVSASPAAGVAYNPLTRVMTWTVGTLTTSDFPVLFITATVDKPTSGNPLPVTNTATVSGTEYDPDPSNNTDSVTETPQYADLAIDKQVSDATPNVGDIITFT